MKLLAPAALLTLMALPISANAAPMSAGAHSGIVADSAQLLLVDDRRDGRGPEGRRGPPPPPPRYVPGRRYDRAPGGWHRFDRRPSGWKTRGCILVGPIWFCP